MIINYKPEGASAPPPTGPKAPIVTRNFLLTALANLFTFASFNVLLATLPLYVVKIGGRESDVGLVGAAFAVTALMARPFSGRAADIWGRKRLMLLGGLGMALSSPLYIVFTSIPALIGVRLIHGVAFGVISTAASALIADIVPPARRGEGVGYFGMSNNAAMAVGPALGIVVMSSLGFAHLFLVSAAIGLAAFLASLFVREPERTARAAGEKRPPLIVRAALFPTSVMFLFMITYAAIVTFLPLFAINRGMSNPGLFFTVQAIVMFSLRGWTGQLSDRFGRGAVAIPGLILGAISQVLMSQASSLPMFLGIAVLYATAFAAIQPSLMALTIDRVRPEMRGAAMGTYISSFDAGIGAGSILWGLVAGVWGYSRMYLVASLMPLISAGLFILISRRQGKP